MSACSSSAIREALNKTAPRRMAVLRPLKVVIENYPEGQIEELEAVNHPDDPAAGSAQAAGSAASSTSSSDDFMENPPKKFFRLSPGNEVRLRYAYFITCREVVKNAAGEVVELRCTYDPATQGRQRAGRPQGQGDACTGCRRRTPCRRKCGSTIRCSTNPDPSAGELRRRPQSAVARSADRCAGRAGAGDAQSAEPVQFERQGYFVRDRDSTPERPVFNRTIGLRDTFAKEVGEGLTSARIGCGRVAFAAS